MFTFQELYENFEAFKAIFASASHAPFANVDIYPGIKPRQEKYSGMELLRRRRLGRPPVYLTPEPGVVAKIILSGEWWDEAMRNRYYTYLIMENGSIKFMSTYEFQKQPKMKWATLINRWMLNHIPRFRQQMRLNVYKEELIATIYSPERVMKTYKDNPDIEWLTE